MEEKGKALLTDISDDDIAEIIKKAKKEAAEDVKGFVNQAAMKARMIPWKGKAILMIMEREGNIDDNDDSDDNDDYDKENDDDYDKILYVIVMVLMKRQMHLKAVNWRVRR